MTSAERRRKLSKSMETLFPEPDSRWLIACKTCEWTIVRSSFNAFDECYECGGEVEKSRQYRCRVCHEPVVDARWNYCSRRCRRIARAVQRMFVWPEVRNRILDRDDYTCQECGVRRESGMEVDHIERLADGGHPFDEANLQTLCPNCHAEKTASENRTTKRSGDPEITLEDYTEP